jgi:predicted site-specific integrase-resolvase
MSEDDVQFVATSAMSRRIGVGGDTLRGWARKGKVPCPRVTPGGKFRWPVREVEAALATAGRNSRANEQGSG